MKSIKTETKYTLEQLIRLSNIKETFGDDDAKLYLEIAKLVYPNANDLPKKEVDEGISQFMQILQEKPDFVLRFTHEGVEYGFIPNLDAITTAEYVDLDTYYKQGINQAHRVMAILYRPIVKRSGNSYEIEKYDGTAKYEKVMLQTDYKIYLSALTFFWALTQSLLSLLPTSSKEKTMMMALMTLMQG